MSNTIWCVGRNYKDHAAEMNAELPSEPLIFIKSWNCQDNSGLIKIPGFTQNLEHEIEIALYLNDSLEVDKISLAIDLTARDIQTVIKEKGHPWALAKSFRNSCMLSQTTVYKGESWFQTLSFELQVNKVSRQKGHTRDMIFSPRQVIDYLKEYYPLKSGDIVLSGTPAGVAPLRPKDKVQCTLDDLIDWSLDVSP